MSDPAAASGTTAGIFSASDAGWRFAGTLTFDDAARVFSASKAVALPANGVVDFSGMMQADSSALAVAIALKRRAAAEGRELSLVGIPASLRSLAVVYGIEDLLA